MNVYDFSARTVRGGEQPLADYRGQVLLIVNTATKCGFAPQFHQLQELYERYREQGFAVLGFPCNQFANQEPGGSEQVEQACRLDFGVTFPLFAKIDVNGPNTDPLFAYLRKRTSGFLGSSIKWNFTKFLVSRDGEAVKRFSPATAPLKFERRIAALLEPKA
ncbi:glutathione peroxidase [Paenibacillus humicola]|uniref:glutathione peroxidase n=1 Tax=Paenibacillus humicola TaxID=3110540 RepID=UPI00237B4FA8|nr:glutathione peroxidase [Paenibacillus humicola]